MPKSDWASFANSVEEGCESLLGTFGFCGSLYDTLAHAKPLAYGFSKGGNIAGAIVASIACAGAYLCHSEVNLANQELDEDEKGLPPSSTQEKDIKETPITTSQQCAIVGEYVAHATGAAGTLLAFYRFFGGPVCPEVEIPLQIAGLLYGLYGATAEARIAVGAMQKNNYRDRFFKELKEKRNELTEVNVDKMVGYGSTSSGNF